MGLIGRVEAAQDDVRFVVRVGEILLVCKKADALARTRIRVLVGDVVKLRETGPGTAEIFFREIHEAPMPSVDAPESCTRAWLIEHGHIRPIGSYDVALTHSWRGAKPSQSVLTIDAAGRKAADARVQAGGIDRDFERGREW